MAEGSAPRDLREYLSELRLHGQLVEVQAEVDPHLELAEIHRRVAAAEGPALWFRNVRGHEHSVVSNLFGSRARCDLAFGQDGPDFLQRAVDFLQHSMPLRPGDLWAQRSLLNRALRTGTSNVRRAPVLAREQSAVNLGALPMTKSWPEDGGSFLTLPMVYTEHPSSGGANLGIYRMQRFDDRHTGMHWQIGKGGGFHYHVAEARDESLPVSVFLGGPPAALLGALAPLPENVPELLIASLVLGRRLRMGRVAGLAHPVLADAEFVLSGRVAAERRRSEGPFGDHYGYYSLEHDYPVFECQRVFHRVEPILPVTVVGKPRQEDFYLGDYLQELLRPMFPLAMPAVRDLWSYGETGFHSLAAAVVRERYRRESMASAFRVLGEGQLSLTKFLLVVDRSLDLTDFRGVLAHVLARFRPQTDLYVLANLSMDSLDYSGPKIESGSKGVLLGVGEAVRDLPREFSSALPPGIDEAIPFAPGCLVLGAASHEKDPDLPSRVAAWESFSDWPWVVLSDEARRAAASSLNFLWTTFTRFDPARDIHSARPSIAANHVVHSLPLVIDARLRDGFPAELLCDPDTAKTVTRRWSELFPRGQEMGDSDRGHLDPPLARS